MTATRCAWWTGLVMVTVWCWTIGAPWWLAAPTVILVTGRTIAALRDWEAASRESITHRWTTDGTAGTVAPCTPAVFSDTHGGHGRHLTAEARR